MSEVYVSEKIRVHFLSELRKARRDGMSWGFLDKGTRATQNIEKISGAVDSLNELGRRAVYHVDRLLQADRSDEERNFAMALIANVGDLVRNDKEIERTSRVVSGESSDTCLWWTLSPYIFDQLKTDNIIESDAIKSLLQWSLTGKTFNDKTGTDKEVNLQGLDLYNLESIGGCTFTLSTKPGGPSHIFARNEAQRLIKNNIFTPKQA